MNVAADASAAVTLIRRTLLRPARPVPARVRVRVAAWLSVAGSLVYVGQKVYMAAHGRVGMPGHPAPASVQAQFEHPGLAQAGNASLGLVAALVAWATVARWGDRAPRWALLSALAVAAVMQSLGAVITIGRADLAPGHLGWNAVYEVASGSVGLAAWAVVTASYWLRTRTRARSDSPGRGRTGGAARPARTAVAAHAALACALAYGLMKLDWALGGEFLMRQAPVPPGPLNDLLNRTPGAVAGHWASVALALVGVAAALHLSGRFGPLGRIRRTALLAGSWAGCAFMVTRAVGLVGYGFAGDIRVLAGLGSVPSAYEDLARDQAFWDLVLWSPYWLFFGTCWGVAAWRYRSRHRSRHRGAG
ncbi:hypothetical protein [Streptomyces triculaminicus]|uniref:hypothetical protein n=1 Tax=Streptomyces triculaminicus TaxID=2816232 RepID=UPI0037D92ACF